IEHIASAAAIARRYSTRSGTAVSGSLDVLAAMHEGDRIAAAVFAEAVDALGAMCAQLVAVVAPEAIVFGGGLSSADELLDGVDSALRSRLDFHR
ncbi:ROK family protein, partial [Mycobacterium tuberculosis]|nr:ROK family protein [Mycobacterium tuberculosis]